MAELCPISEKDVKKPRSNSISQLPDHILHSIFCYLTSQDLFHVRLVSKNWHRNTPSYFPLQFDEFTFFKITPTTTAAVLQESHNSFLQSISSSLEICQSELNKAEKRVIRVQFRYHENINDLFKLINAIDFHEVYLRFGFSDYLIPFNFQSKCLTVLHLTRCRIDKHLFSGEANFTSLQEVGLDSVKLTGETLSKFISKCPNIGELRLVNCNYLRSLVLPKVNRLKKLHVQVADSYPSITDVLVIAPSLQVFHFVQYNSSKDVVNMDIRACRMLREFHLECNVLPVGLDHEHFISDFPHLENLTLGPCETSKRVKISSPSLRKLTLMFTQLYNYNYSRKSVVVSVPNLCYFHYVGRTFKSSLAPSETPKFLKIIGISLVPHIEKINRAWFLQLRSHLKKISNCVALALIIRDETIFSELSKRGHKLWSIPIGRSPTQVVPHIEHLKLDIRLNVPQESHGCLLKYSIDNLLWMSHPNALTLSTPASFAAFALGICNEFLISRKEGNCCTDTQNKCWRHFLKDFMIREVVTDEKMEKPLKILGPSLRKCILFFPSQYEYSRKIIVSAPNSSFFQYMDAPILPSLAPLSDTSKLLESIILVLVPRVEVMNRGWFLKLRSHLESFSNYNTILDLRIREETSYFVGKYPRSKLNGRTPTQPLHHIKHLMLDMIKLKFQQEYLMKYIIDNLLWMSHPNSLTLSIIPSSFASLAYGVSKELYGRRDRNCCSSTHEKCWRHFLKHF